MPAAKSSGGQLAAAPRAQRCEHALRLGTSTGMPLAAGDQAYPELPTTIKCEHVLSYETPLVIVRRLIGEGLYGK